MRRAVAALCFCALLLVACDDDVNPQQKALNENRSKWNDAGLSSYVYHEWRVCYCVSEGPIVVTVYEGVVTSAFFQRTGVMLEPDRLARMRTIEEFFDYVQDAIDRDVDELIVAYDPTYGFPADTFVNEGFDLIDDEISYYITDFQ